MKQNLFKTWLMLCLFLLVGGGNSAWGATDEVNSQAPTNDDFIIALYYSGDYYALPYVGTSNTSDVQGKKCILNVNGEVTEVEGLNSPSECVWKLTEGTGTNSGTYQVQSYGSNGNPNYYLYKAGTSGTSNHNMLQSNSSQYWNFIKNTEGSVVKYTMKSMRGSANTIMKNNGGKFYLDGTSNSYDIYLLKVGSSGPATPPEAPTFSPVAGTIEKGTQITFYSETTGCTFRYTTDGTNPTATTGTIGSTYTVNSDVTLKVVAVKGGLASETVSSASYTVAKHNATFYINGTSNTTSYAKGDAITVPSNIADIEGKKFQGWVSSPISGTTDTKPTFVTPATTMGTEDVTYYAVFASVNSAESTYDLTNEEIKKNNATTSYGSINVTSDSGTWPCNAILNKATGYIQINKNKSNYYIGTPNFDKNIAKITINTCNSTASGRTFYLMGNTNTAQPSSSSIGSASTSSSNGSVEIPVSGDYSQLYIYANGAAYISSIKIVSKSDVSDYTTSVVKKYDVTFNLQEHGEAIASQAIAEGETVTEPTAPEATGYTFGGWYKEAECTNAWNFSTDVMGTSAITLYAKWTVNTYTITYNNVEGATNSNPATYTIETATINLAYASKDGYIFQGWFDNEGLTGDAVTTIAQGSTGDKTFWAKWTEIPANPSTVTFNVGEHGTCETASATEETVGAGVALPEVTANEGWVFKGWSTENPATAESIVSAGDDGKYHILANTTLYAFYKVKPATPAFSSEAGAIEKGTEVTISCTTDGAAIYYTTNGDEPTAESVVYSEAITVSAAQTLKAIAILDGEQSEVATAEYTIVQHTAQFSINGVITAANNCTAAKGEAITFPADPTAPEEHVFIGWKKGGDEVTTPQNDAIATVDKATEVMGTDDVTYYAVWAVGSGSGEASVHELTQEQIAAAYVGSGDNKTTSYGNYEFGSGWSGSCLINKYNNVSFVQIRKNNANNYILSPDFGGAVASITINTTASASTTNTLADRTFYLCGNNETAQPSSGDYGSGSISEDNGSVTIDVTGEPHQFYIYANGGAYIKSISVTYGSGSSYSDYCTKVVIREISSIAVETAPTTVNYFEGEKFNPEGLKITVNYTEGEPEVVAYAGNEAKFTFSPALDAELTAENDKVTITYKNNTCQQAISVRAVSINAPVAEGGSYTVKVGDAEAVTADGNTIAAKKGQKIVLASTANPGYRVQSTPFEVKDENNEKVSVSTAGGQYSFIMPDNNVTITAKFSKLYTLTAAAMTNGSIAIKWNGAEVTEAVKGNKIVVDVTPVEHYHLNSLYYMTEGSETQNTIEKTDDVYSFTMEDANTTIYATFAEDEKVTITWSINGNTDRTSEVYVGEAISFPTNVDDINNMVFRGWVGETNKSYTSDNVAPTYANAREVIASENATYYAVFATASVGEDEEKTSTLTLNNGSVTSPYSNQDVTWNFSGLTFCSSNQQTSGMPNGASVSFTLPNNAKAVKFTITSTSNSWSTSNISLALKYGETAIQTFNNAGEYEFTESNNDKGSYSLTASNQSSKVAYIKTLSIKYLIPGTTYTHFCTILPSLTVETTDGVTTVTGTVSSDEDVASVTTGVVAGTSLDMTEATVSDDVLSSISTAVANKNILIYAPNSSESTANNVVVDGTCANLVLTDKVAVNIPEEITATNITYERKTGDDIDKLVAGKYATVCLPYAFPIGNFKVMKFTGVDGGVVKFEYVTETEPNVPYVIRPNNVEEAYLSFNITGGENSVSTAPAAPVAEGMSVNDKDTDKMLAPRKAARNDATGFYGTYEELTLNGSDGYYGFASGVFKKANTDSGTLIRPFRAYLFIDSSNGARPASFNFSEGEATAINNVFNALDNNLPMYDLSGRRIQTPAKGQIVIVGGQKVMFK